MQRQTGITAATTFTTTGIQFGLAVAGTYALPRASAMHRVVSNRPDPVKPKRSDERGHSPCESWQPSSAAGETGHLTVMRRVDARLAAPAGLPPRLWAAWVLSQSLCG
jgi:hypothetical protein